MSFLDYVALLVLLTAVVGFARYVHISGREVLRSQLAMHRQREKAIKGQYDKPERDTIDHEKP